MTSTRFVRMAPIISSSDSEEDIQDKNGQDRRVHYCLKDNKRQFYAVCQDRQCNHFRPLRTRDDGSCSFKSEKQKKEIKRSNGKEEEKSKEIVTDD